MTKCVLGEFADLIPGVSYTPDGIASSGVRILRGGNIRSSELQLKEDDVILSEDYQCKDNEVHEGDTIVVASSGSADAFGKAATSWVDLPGVQIGAFLRIVRPKKREYAALVSAWVTQPIFQRYIGSVAKGTGINNIRKEYVEEYPISVDDSSLKQFSELYESICKKIALNRKRIATLEAMAKEIYDYWFVQFDFPDAHGRPYKSSGGAMVYNSDLKREIPKGWEVKPLAEAVKELNSGEWGSDTCGETSSVEVHCLRGADMEDQSSIPVRYIAERKTDKLLSVGDIVIEMSGGSPTRATGRSCYVSQGLWNAYNGKLTCTNFCNSLKLKDPDETAYFLFVWRMFYQAGLMFNFEGKTSGLKNLQIDSLLATKWLFPPKELATKFNKLHLSLTAQTDNCKKEISRLLALRDFLLPMLMNGQVKVG